MHDPIAAGRSAAARAVAIEVAVTGLVATGFLAMGWRHALAAAMGGLAMTAGNALAAAVALGGGIRPAGAAFARLMLAVLGKWVMVLAIFALALVAWRLPPLPTLAGLAVSAAAYLLAASGLLAPRGWFQNSSGLFQKLNRVERER